MSILNVHNEQVIDSSRAISNIVLRNLFIKMCNEVTDFSEGVRLRVTPFDLVFSDSNLFEMTITPYRNLFKISFGERHLHEIRVASLEDFFTALDMALHYFLSTRESRDHT